MSKARRRSIVGIILAAFAVTYVVRKSTAETTVVAAGVVAEKIIGEAVVAAVGGVTEAEVPAPVNNPLPSGLMIRGLVTRVESPTRIRHRTTVPLTGEDSPPLAWRSGARETLANVGRGL